MKGARFPATVALRAATAVWGPTFVVTKGVIHVLDPASFLTWRFGIATAALLVARPSGTRAQPLASPQIVRKPLLTSNDYQRSEPADAQVSLTVQRRSMVANCAGVVLGQ